MFSFSTMDTGPLSTDLNHPPLASLFAWVWLLSSWLHWLVLQATKTPKKKRKRNPEGMREQTLFQLVLWVFFLLFSSLPLALFTPGIDMHPLSVVCHLPHLFPPTAHFDEDLSWLNLLGSLSDLLSKQHVFYSLAPLIHVCGQKYENTRWMELRPTNQQFNTSACILITLLRQMV